MRYSILCDGVNIYDASPNMGILNPQLDLEDNSVGSLKFTMTPTHTYYNDVVPFVSDIEVWDGEDLLFFGRVIDTTIDFLNRKQVTCEGALGFLNDTVQPPKIWEKPDPDDPSQDPEMDEIYLSDFLEYLLEEHNKYMTFPNRQIKMGTFGITDKKVSRELDYEKTLDCVQNMCVKAEGGHLFIRKETNGVFLDWLSDFPGISNQPIQYALNLTDIKQDFKGSTYATTIIPIGKDDLTLQTVDPDSEEEEEDPNERNPGEIYVDSEAVETYGRIIEKVDFDDVDDKIILYQKAVKWLEDKQFNALTISVTSADLSFFNSEYGVYKIGQSVHVTSNPHLIDKDFPIVKISYKLDSPIKNITIGTVPRESLTELYASGGGGGGKGSVTKSKATRIAQKVVDNINYVDKIAENLDLVIDEYDTTIHALYGDDPEMSDQLLLDSTGNDIVSVLDDISDRLLHIGEYTEPDPEPEEEPEEPGE